jgi:hypothetical protein
MNINKIVMFSFACIGTCQLANAESNTLSDSDVDHRLGILFQNSRNQDQTDINRAAIGGIFLPDFFEPFFKLDNAVDTLNYMIEGFNARFGVEKVWKVKDATNIQIFSPIDKTGDELFAFINILREYTHAPFSEKINPLKDVFLKTTTSNDAETSLTQLIQKLTGPETYNVYEEILDTESVSISHEVNLVKSAIDATKQLANTIVEKSAIEEIHQLFIHFEESDNAALKLFEITNADDESVPEDISIAYKLSPKIDTSLVESLRRDRNELHAQMRILLNILTHIAYKVH